MLPLKPVEPERGVLFQIPVGNIQNSGGPRIYSFQLRTKFKQYQLLKTKGVSDRKKIENIEHTSPGLPPFGL
jgi:hypothetical protein